MHCIPLLSFINHRNQSQLTGQDLPSWTLGLHNTSDRNEKARASQGTPQAALLLPKQTISTVPSRTPLVRGLLIDQTSALGPILETRSSWSPTHDFVTANAQVADCASTNYETPKVLRQSACALVAGPSNVEHYKVRNIPLGFRSWSKTAQSWWARCDTRLGCVRSNFHGRVPRAMDLSHRKRIAGSVYVLLVCRKAIRSLFSMRPAGLAS